MALTPRKCAEMKAWDAKNPIEPGSVHTVLDHIDHIAKVAGVDHVGLGSDFDGITMVPKELEDVSTYPKITQGLLDRGYSEQDIKKILGGNLLRAMVRGGNSGQAIVGRNQESARPADSQLLRLCLPPEGEGNSTGRRFMHAAGREPAFYSFLEAFWLLKTGILLLVSAQQQF